MIRVEEPSDKSKKGGFWTSVIFTIIAVYVIAHSIPSSAYYAIDEWLKKEVSRLYK